MKENTTIFGMFFRIVFRFFVMMLIVILVIHMVMYRLLNGIVFEMLLGMSAQAAYNTMVFFEFFAIIALYWLFVLRPLKSDVLEMLKTEQTVQKTIVDLLRSPGLWYFLIAALLAAYPSFMDTTAQIGSPPNQREEFRGFLSGFAPLGPFRMIVSSRILAYVLNVLSFGVLQAGVTALFVRRVKKNKLSK